MMGASNRDAVIDMYDRRADVYDGNEKMSSHHVKLGQDFVEWTRPRKGDTVLDLACGTGLVALPLAEAVGSDGIVVGVDITPGMLAVARAKIDKLNDSQRKDLAQVELHECDITSDSLKEIPSIKTILDQGGFDVITCCSALILLPDPAAAVKLWASMLKRGGKIIIDVTTEYPNLQYLITDTLRDELGIEKDWDRSWVKGKHTLEDAYRDAGLKITQSWKTESVAPVTVFDGDEDTGLRLFDQETLKYHQYQERGLQGQARAIWPKIWKSVINEQGKYVDSHCLYVCIGEKV